MAKYKLGGVPVELDNAQAGIPVIHPNRTVFVQKLTEKAPRNPEVVEGLQSEEDVFKHYAPSCKVEFTDENGRSKKEEIHFEDRSHFGKKGLVEQSEFLTHLDERQKNLVELIKKVKSDKFLQKALADDESKAAFINGLKSMIQLLNDNE